MFDFLKKMGSGMQGGGQAAGAAGAAGGMKPGGSMFSNMDMSQKLSALGSIFGGDDEGIAKLIAQQRGQGGGMGAQRPGMAPQGGMGAPQAQDAISQAAADVIARMGAADGMSPAMPPVRARRGFMGLGGR